MQTTLYKIHIFCIFIKKNLHISKKSCTFAAELNDITNLLTTKMYQVMKTIKTIKLIEVTNGRLTVFNSAIEKQQFIQTHQDAYIHDNYAIEPLYMLIDTEESGFCLNPQRAITYNEALTVIKHYF